MTDYHCENCEFFENRSTDKLIDGYCKKYNQSLIFYDWFEKCDKCIEEEKMTEQEIERCLERLATCKTTDVMNFDYAGTLAYIKRLKSENVALRNEADENAALSMENKMRADRLEKENAALRERLDKATLNRSIYYIASIWNDATMARRQEVRCRTVDYVCDKFVKCNGLTLNWDEIYFTREAAFARLAELKGGER